MTNKMNKIKRLCIFISALFIVQQANAGLILRDSGMVYDNVLNITWLQDANFAKTSQAANADGSGKLTWLDANNWADNLSYGGFDDWRLATYDTPNSDLSELSYMFINNLGNSNSLGNKSFIDAASGESHSFDNLFGSRYWTDTAVSDTKAWSFSFSNGTENKNKLKADPYKAWAVRSGDVITAPTVDVPEPSSIALFGFAFVGLLLMTNRKHNA